MGETLGGVLGMGLLAALVYVVWSFWQASADEDECLAKIGGLGCRSGVVCGIALFASIVFLVSAEAFSRHFRVLVTVAVVVSLVSLLAIAALALAMWSRRSFLNLGTERQLDRFPCPHCGKTLSATKELAGKKAKCPHCGEILVSSQPTRREIRPEQALPAQGLAAQAPAVVRKTPDMSSLVAAVARRAEALQTAIDSFTRSYVAFDREVRGMVFGFRAGAVSESIGDPAVRAQGVFEPFWSSYDCVIKRLQEVASACSGEGCDWVQRWTESDEKSLAQLQDRIRKARDGVQRLTRSYDQLSTERGEVYAQFDRLQEALDRCAAALQRTSAKRATMRVTCPKCGETLTTKGELAGKRGKCPKCGAVFVVPTTTGGSMASVRDESTRLRGDFGERYCSARCRKKADRMIRQKRSEAGGFLICGCCGAPVDRSDGHIIYTAGLGLSAGYTFICHRHKCIETWKYAFSLDANKDDCVVCGQKCS